MFFALSLSDGSSRLVDSRSSDQPSYRRSYRPKCPFWKVNRIEYCCFSTKSLLKPVDRPFIINTGEGRRCRSLLRNHSMCHCVLVALTGASKPACAKACSLKNEVTPRSSERRASCNFAAIDDYIILLGTVRDGNVWRGRTVRTDRGLRKRAPAAARH